MLTVAWLEDKAYAEEPWEEMMAGSMGVCWELGHLATLSTSEGHF